jgi:hypothetical protein
MNNNCEHILYCDFVHDEEQCKKCKSDIVKHFIFSENINDKFTKRE